MKIQIIGGKVCLKCKCKTSLEVLNTKSLLTSPSNVLPYYLKETFPPIIWIFTEGKGDEIKSRLFSTLSIPCSLFCLKLHNCNHAKGWYKNKDGINFVIWPSNLLHYWWITRKISLLENYRITFGNNDETEVEWFDGNHFWTIHYGTSDIFSCLREIDWCLILLP